VVWVFVAVCISLPIFLFSNFDKLVEGKTFPKWLAENGWWSVAGLEFVGLWLLGSVALSLLSYGAFSGIALLIERGKSSTLKLEVTYEDEPPYTEDSGPSGLGYYYRNRLIGITSPVDGVVTVKVRMVRLENGQIRSNVFLIPASQQPEHLDAADPGYWRVVQWNTSETSIKLVHKGKESYYLGPESRFEIVVKCAGSSKRIWAMTKIEGRELLFRLSENDNETWPIRLGLKGNIICLDVAPVLNLKNDRYYDCFLILCVKVTNDAAPTMVSRWQLDLLWQDVEYPSVRQSVEDYYANYPSSHADDLQMKFERRPLYEFRKDEEITNANYKNGWLRFKVGTFPIEAIGEFQRLRKEVMLRLEAFDSKDNPHLIYEGSSYGLSGCGQIERSKKGDFVYSK
jgi:hypothetical protein